MRIAMKPGQRRVLPDTPEGGVLNLKEEAKAHVRAKVEHPFGIIKCQFGFRKVFYRGIRKEQPQVDDAVCPRQSLDGALTLSFYSVNGRISVSS